MQDLDFTIKILDVTIKFIALVFPIVLFRKQILHFSHLIGTDISITESRSKYFPKGTIGIECTNGKLVNACISLLLIESNNCKKIIFEKINGLPCLNIGHINKKSRITIELEDTNIFDLLEKKLNAEKDKIYLLVLVTYSEKYDKNVFIKEKLYTIYNPGEYILTDKDKNANDTGLAGRDIGLPDDLINNKKLRYNIDINTKLQNKIIDEISHSFDAMFSRVKMAYCIPRIIFKYFNEKNRRLLKNIK